MNYSDIKYFDVINGLGVRVSIFVSGCSHHCEHCFNKLTWNKNYGKPFDNSTQNKILDYIEQFSNTISGISLLGGDPTFYDNIEPLCIFIDKFKDRFKDKNIWIWSGYTWEQIINDKFLLKLIERCDVLIDGKYKDSLKDLNLKFRGSNNQRVIDIKASLKNNKIVKLID